MKYKSIRGMEDILPGDTPLWQRLECIARKNLEMYGYSEIRTPVLEDTAVFIRSIGETTDIVTKEMYTFTDRKKRSLTLRPEGTAPVVRSYIEHSLDKSTGESRLYYIGPMFRSERPQKGRSRQFHQIGTEVIGTSSPYADVEVITQLTDMLKQFGLEDFTIKLNSLGCASDKAKFAEGLKNYLKDKNNRLCDDCKTRVKKNVLRVLDCKNEVCIQLVNSAPNVLDAACTECREHFDTVKGTLTSLGIAFKEAKNLVRGLDYYTKTVFEISHLALGAQDAIGAGGRYDNLVKDFGGPALGAIGYAIGMERIIMALGKTEKKPGGECISIATLGGGAKIEGMRLADEIRKNLKVSALTDIKGTSLKSQLRAADKVGSKIVVIIGEDEIKKGIVIVRNMFTKEQTEVPRHNVMDILRKEKEVC